jgi:hypothetical protein
MNNVYGSGFHLPVDFLVALAANPLRLWVYGLRPAYGITRFLHLFGMAGFLGLVLLLEVMRLGVFPAASIQGARRAVVTLMNTTFALTVLTGILLFLYDPIGAGLHTMFLPKLLLVTLGLLHASYIERMPAMRRPSLKRLSAGAALTIWVLVIGCSTWNAVERPLNPADIHRTDPRMK